MVKVLMRFVTVFCAVCAVLLVSTTDADAKRLGGGKSFGSKPAYSTPYQPSRPSASSASQSTRQQATQSNQALRDSFARRGGLGSMLGGLLIGGILGSMLFGGAFEGLNFADLLIFGVIAFLLYRLFAARKRVFEPAEVGATGATRYSHSPADATWGGENPGSLNSKSSSGTARFNTDLLFGQNRGESSRKTDSTPAEFNEPQFMSGARAAYRMLQEAWDKGDLSGLRALTTEQIFSELKSQINERSGSNITRIIDLKAELLDVSENANLLEASVLFTAELEEETGMESRIVSEVWHFIRPVGSTQPTWFLDGIQQAD